jgi:anoctamin-10/anoctamin-7
LWLNNYENHRTDTEFEDALISKVFIFQLVNSFAALTYVSFIKNFLGISCVKNNCIGDAAASLSTIFIVRLMTSAVTQVFVRQFLQGQKEASETKGLEPGVFPTPLEEQYILDEYPVLLGTLQDYAALIIQYGFTILFVGAAPIAPLLSFVSSYIQIRIDGWRLCQAHRRPQPRTAEDIGVWQDMVEIISFLSVVYNFGLLFFTSHYLIDVSWEFRCAAYPSDCLPVTLSSDHCAHLLCPLHCGTRWIMFIVVEHSMFILKGVLSSSIGDTPEEVEMQLARQNFLCSKVIDNMPDPVEEEYQMSSKKTNIIIADSDYDWEDPNAGNDVDDDEDADVIPPAGGGGGEETKV